MLERGGGLLLAASMKRRVMKTKTKAWWRWCMMAAHSLAEAKHSVLSHDLNIAMASVAAPLAISPNASERGSAPNTPNTPNSQAHGSQGRASGRRGQRSMETESGSDEGEDDENEEDGEETEEEEELSFVGPSKSKSKSKPKGHSGGHSGGGEGREKEKELKRKLKEAAARESKLQDALRASVEETQRQRQEFEENKSRLREAKASISVVKEDADLLRAEAGVGWPPPSIHQHPRATHHLPSAPLATVRPHTPHPTPLSACASLLSSRRTRSSTGS